MNIYITKTKVKKIDKRGDHWFVLFDNTTEWTDFGTEEPELKVGQTVIIKIEPQ